jgi:hypothetical protein
MTARFGRHVRVVAITAIHDVPDQPGIAVIHDRHGAFAAVYGDQKACFLVRPDGYIGWRGRSWRDPGLLTNLGRILKTAT